MKNAAYPWLKQRRNTLKDNIRDVDLIRLLLYQQFFYGDDTITGRTRDYTCNIEGSGATIEIFYGYLIENVDDIRNKQYYEYLKKFNNDYFSFDLEKVYSNIENKFDLLEDYQLTPTIIASILIGELLMSLKKNCFKNALNELKVILSEKIQKYNKGLENKIDRIELTEELINSKMEKLKRLFSLNNGEIGMIYNLSFLKTLALKIDLQVYYNTQKKLKSYMENISEKIY